jgi:serine/threonine-protein kinase
MTVYSGQERFCPSDGAHLDYMSDIFKSPPIAQGGGGPVGVEFYGHDGTRYVASAPQPFAYGRTSVFYNAATADGRAVCIKLFRELDPSAIPGADEFITELSARQRVQHAHVLPILDYGVLQATAPSPFLVLPYCEGGDLRKQMKARAIAYFPLAEAIVFLRRVASAIDFAHDAGLIHGDIKPENILFGKTSGEAFLTDFGSARAVPVLVRVSADDLARSGGTEDYISPEELLHGETTQLSDIYAFAWVAYEALTGRSPVHRRPTAASCFAAKISGDLDDPVSANPTLSRVAADALLEALSPDPADRPRSATEFCDRLIGASPPKKAREARTTPRDWWAGLPPSGRVAIVTAAIAAVAGIVTAIIKIIPELLG